MAYSKQTWQNLPNKTTPVNAERLGHIEDGIYDNSINIEQLSTDIDQINEDLEDYALLSETGYRIEFVLDSSTYQLQANLKNKSGTTITSSNVIDLPIEQLVANIYYDENTKEIVFVLKSGTEVRVSIADIVSGLQPEITTTNKLSSDLVDDTNKTHKFVSSSEKTTWNAKYAKPSGGIPKTDLASAVQTSLGKADTALQPQDIIGKEDKENKVTEISSNSTDTEYPSAKAVYTKEQETKADLENQLEETNAQLDQYKKIFNALPKVNGSGEVITLNDTAECPLEIEIKGNTSQFSTTGKNLLEPKFTSGTDSGITCTYSDKGWKLSGTSSASYSAFDIFSKTLSAGTYTINGLTNASNTTFQLRIYINGTASSYVKDTSVTFPLEADSTVVLRLYAYGTRSETLAYQLESGSSATSYEPYTNGASPNPDYPQDIEVVSGNNKVVVCGKNLIKSLRRKFIGNIEWYYQNSAISNTMTISFTLDTSISDGRLYIKSSASGTAIAIASPLNVTANVKYTKTFTLTNEQVELMKSSLEDGVIQIYKSGVDFTNTTIVEPQLEIGSTATTYEPYQSQEYSVNLGSLELCKIGDYKDKIKRSSGKNLFNTLTQGYADTGVTVQVIDNNNVKITYSGNSASYRKTNYSIYNLKANTDYTFKAKITNTNSSVTANWLQVKSIDDTEMLYNAAYSSENIVTFNTGENTSVHIYLYAIGRDSATENIATWSNIQLEKGSQTTTYEPYGKVWCKYREVRHLSLNISDMNNTNDDYPGWTGVQEIKDDYPNQNTQLYQLTSYLLNMVIYKPAACSINTLSSNRLIFLPKTTYSLTQTQWKTNYPNLIMELYYGLQTPTNEPITDTTLINQLNAIEKAYAYQNQTNISQVNADKPFIIDATTLLDISNIENRVTLLED